MAVVADWTLDKTSGTIPFTVKFTDLSTGFPNNWWWDFGDGTVGSTLQNPTHTYMMKGQFKVTLYAWKAKTSPPQPTTIDSTSLSWTKRGLTSPMGVTESIAWDNFHLPPHDVFVNYTLGGIYTWEAARVTSGGGGFRYFARRPIFNLNLTSVPSNRVVLLRYGQYRQQETTINCWLPYETIFKIHNNSPLYDTGSLVWLEGHDGDFSLVPLFSGQIPKFEFVNTTGVPQNTSVQIVGSPDLIAERNYIGENLTLECTDGNNYTQRLGETCINDPSFPPPSWSRTIEMEKLTALVYENETDGYSSKASTNFIIANDNIIQRPPILYSGIKEAFFPDYWKNEKHLYIQQTKAQPCIVQFVDVYAKTTN